MKIVLGLVLLFFGASMFLLLFFGATRTDTVIDISFVLQPGEKYEPYENGTYHHTRVISKSTLTGEVLVEGGDINFTANGYNTQHLENVFINQNYSFVINPADDLYMFTFHNAGSGIQSSVKFILKEKWTDILLLISAFIILVTSATVGMVLIIFGLQKKTSRQSPS
jgi:hypothetical protein